jgi:hypothetical protein
MDAHPARLDDPQCTGDGMRFQDIKEVPQPVENALYGRALPNLQHDDSCAPFLGKPQHLTKIPIEREERSPLCRAKFRTIFRP